MLSAGLLVEHAMEPVIVDKWKYWTFSDLAGSMGMIIAWYYLGLGYLIANLAVLFFARHKWRDLTARRYAALNIAVFAVHSALVIALVFDASLTLPFWFAWIAMILFNWLAPKMLWRRLCT